MGDIKRVVNNPIMRGNNGLSNIQGFEIGLIVVEMTNLEGLAWRIDLQWGKELIFPQEI